MDRALGSDGWVHRESESWIRMRGTFVPYPFQFNLHRLPAAERWECARGLLEARLRGRPSPSPPDFRAWILATFGEGVARSFMFPYNLKVWAYPLERLGWQWITERVAVPAVSEVL